MPRRKKPIPPSPPRERWKNQRNPFDATTQGLGRNEMVRRTYQHEILATKKYEQSLQYDLKGRKMYDWVSSHQSNPWIVRDQLRSEAKKMWDTAGSFEQGSPVVRGTKERKKLGPIVGGYKKPTKPTDFFNRQLAKTIRKIENPIGYVYNTGTEWYSKSKKKHGFTGGSYLDLSVNKTGKYGVDY
jgi:hypothetical protein